MPPKGTAGSARTRPTLTVLPRGDDTGLKQPKGKLNIYRFPALVAKGGLDKLIKFSLERFAKEVGTASPPGIARLILTAHSGGGAALMAILGDHDPDQVHVFDALYGNPDPLIDWAAKRIRRDRTAVQGLDLAACRAYMQTRGGAMRVFYQDRVPEAPGPSACRCADVICDDLGPELHDWYRVEASKSATSRSRRTMAGGYWPTPRPTCPMRMSRRSPVTRCACVARIRRSWSRRNKKLII